MELGGIGEIRPLRDDVHDAANRPAAVELADRPLQDLDALDRWYQRQLAALPVRLELDTDLTAQDVLDRAPDAVVLAVGATPSVPPVPGAERAIYCVAALTGASLPCRRIVVVGGGLVGCETALGYAQEGKEVTVVEALPDILSAGIPVPEMNDSMLRDLLAEAGVRIETGCRLTAVTDAGAEIDGPSGPRTLAADHVVLAVGFRSRPSLKSALIGRGIPVYEVGDGSRVGNVMTAIGSAYTVGRSL